MTEMIYYILLSMTGAIQVVVYASLVWPAHAAINGQICLYVLFLAACFGFCAIAQWSLPQHWKHLEGRRDLKIFLSIEMILTFFLLSALFKLVVYDRWPQIAQHIYHVLLVLLLLNKIFYRSIISFGKGLYAFVINEQNLPFLTQMAAGGFVLTVIFLLYLPDPQGVVARVFMGEQFHNWDTCVFAPAFAYLKGLLLDVDVISHYGLGMPMVVAYLTKLFGTLSYEHMLMVLMWMSIVYYVTWFFLLRQWLGGVLIPIAGILFAIRCQMFHSLTYPLVYTYPSATPLRFFFDVAVFFSLWRHIKTKHSLFLYAAAFFCGFMLFYMTAEGLYITGAFYVYLLMGMASRPGHLSLGHLRSSMGQNIIYFLLVPFVAFGFIVLTQGEHAFSPLFWQNMGEFREYFFSGFSLSAMENSLKVGNFLEFLMGFVVPIVYMLTVLIAGSFWYLKASSDKYLLAVVIAIEGLGLYHYYAFIGYGGSYYMLGLPFNFLTAFWVNEGLSLMSVSRRSSVSLGLVSVCAWALLTNQHFISYPNLMNFSRNPLIDTSVVQFPVGRASYFNHLFRDYPESAKLPRNSLGEIDEKLRFENDFLTDEDLKAYYLKETDFSPDAGLIKKWTAPDERVALISSFEVEMLLQADRKPFFYYFPLLNSRPLRMRMFHIALLYTHQQLARIIDSLEQRKPTHIFMERIYLYRRVPASYYYDTPVLMALLEYVNTHYEPVDNGLYLVAMRRKG